MLLLGVLTDGFQSLAKGEGDAYDFSQNSDILFIFPKMADEFVNECK